MNYRDAFFAMQEGKKVKLPEWIGYWWMPDINFSGDREKCIRVLTKSGDILDTPWIDKYRSRDDWEITDGALGFEFAILALKNGKKVTCRAMGFNWIQLSKFEVKKGDEEAVIISEIIRCAPAGFVSDKNDDAQKLVSNVVYQPWEISSRWLLFTDYSLCQFSFIADKPLVYTPVDNLCNPSFKMILE
jgi:hypothetical protein